MYQREVISDEHTVNHNERNFKKKDTNIEIQEKNINDLVVSASRVIAPLWPISTFAAHHPWMGLEKQSFEQVANWLKEARNVDIYPSASMIHSAKAKGEIEESFYKLACLVGLIHNLFICRERQRSVLSRSFKVRKVTF